jgi:HEAT repeat protein
MQLFVVPMVIVIIIVMVCLMFNWLAHLGTNPEDLVDDLTRLNAGSWQKALTIAQLLNDKRQVELRRDDALAKRLAQILDDQIEAGEMDPEQIKLRVYLCSALGVFEVNEGQPTLMRAASTQRDPREIEIRMAAIEALARRADAVPEGRGQMQGNSELMQIIQKASNQNGGPADESVLNDQLRSRAAFAFGVIGGEQSLDRLAIMLSDPYPPTRFNAATGLARNGDPRAVPQLREMLDPSSLSMPDGVPVNDATRLSVVSNALRASTQLASANPTADLSDLEAAIAKLIDIGPGGGVKVDAQLALKSLQTRSSE